MTIEEQLEKRAGEVLDEILQEQEAIKRAEWQIPPSEELIRWTLAESIRRELMHVNGEAERRIIELTGTSGSGKRMTPIARAEKVVLYLAWAFVPEGREAARKAIARAIAEAELAVAEEKETRTVDQWEYCVEVINGDLLNHRAGKGWEPFKICGIDHQRIILRRRKPFEPQRE